MQEGPAFIESMAGLDKDQEQCHRLVAVGWLFPSEATILSNYLECLDVYMVDVALLWLEELRKYVARQSRVEPIGDRNALHPLNLNNLLNRAIHTPNIADL